MIAAAEIAAALGGACRSGSWWRCRCPVHDSRGATLALRDGDHGLVVHCHGGCPRSDILAELCHRGLIAISTRRRPSKRRSLRRAAARAVVADQAEDEARRIAIARSIWNRTHEARGTPVVAYLAGRGLAIDLPLSLRWAPSLRHPDGRYGPAMVGLVEHAERGIVGVHRTWIGADVDGTWRRIDRRSLGPIGSGAVRLAAAADTLMVGEGVETCLAAMQATGMPAWAALSAGGIEALILPQIVRDVIIIGDNDANGRGQRAARKAAQRWLAEGRRVRIALPPEADTDMNDVLLGRCGAVVGEERDHAA